MYSSVTGNTQAVAGAIHRVLPESAVLSPVYKAPDPETFDFIALGFWVRRAKPDPRMLRYMERVRGKRVAWFGTLVARPDSEHAGAVRRNATEALAGNSVLGGILCQGRLPAKKLAGLLDGTLRRKAHPMTEERRALLIQASQHPDAEDFAMAGAAFRDFLQRAKRL